MNWIPSSFILLDLSQHKVEYNAQHGAAIIRPGTVSMSCLPRSATPGSSRPSGPPQISPSRKNFLRSADILQIGAVKPLLLHAPSSSGNVQKAIVERGPVDSFLPYIKFYSVEMYGSILKLWPCL